MASSRNAPRKPDVPAVPSTPRSPPATPAAGPGLASIRPELASERTSRESSLARASSAIIDAVEQLAEDAVRSRAVAMACVALGLDPEALYYLDKAKGEDFGRCSRCGRTWRDTAGPRW
jgi:hypothetical protein